MSSLIFSDGSINSGGNDRQRHPRCFGIMRPTLNGCGAWRFGCATLTSACRVKEEHRSMVSRRQPSSPSNRFGVVKSNEPKVDTRCLLI